MSNPREDQFEAAIAEAGRIVERVGKQAFVLDIATANPGSPVRAWAGRYATELDRNVTRKCPHGGWSQVHTVFGADPNRALCKPCADKRGGELMRDARSRMHRPMECDFCHVAFPREAMVPVVFQIAAVVVQAAMCAGCLSDSVNRATTH